MNNFEYKKLTPFKWFVLDNFPFIEADFDALTNWQLFCKLGNEMNKIIESENTLGTQVETVTDAFIELQNYVNNYFENLDVQEEIDNKLDEMVEDGTLAEIITSYLQISGVLAFNTISDLKSATNLIDGSFVKTYGYNAINDGGGSFYKIRQVTNQDTEDDAFIIALNDENLVAELMVSSELKLAQIGANITNNATSILEKALNYINNKKYITLILEKGYTFTEIDLTGISGISIKGSNSKTRIKVNTSITVPTNHNSFKDLCFELQTDTTLLLVSGTYNTFNNCNFYGKNNHKGIGANISNFVNSFTDCSFREFAQCIIASSNEINFINCNIIGNDSPAENENTVTITNGLNINFTNCDIEKGYNIINITGGLVNFNGCYIEGATSFYHILLTGGIISLLNNYLNNIKIGKNSTAKITMINNMIEKANASDYTLYPTEQNIGYIVAMNNKFKNENGLFIVIDGLKQAGVNYPCPRYYNGTTWVAGTRNDYLYIAQERCYGYSGVGSVYGELTPEYKPKRR